MISYSLICDNQHTFDAWFRNGKAYDDQHAKGIVACPVCGSIAVEKAMMAPSVARSGSDKMVVSAGHPDHAKVLAALRELRTKIVSEADNVGDRFAEEARKIHFKETKARGIYGEATREEVTALLDDGIEFMALPPLPEEHN